MSISTIGIKENEEQFKIWQEDMDEMFNRLEPKNLIVYGGEVNYEYPEYCDVYYYENAVIERLKLGI